jgi:hypothetical protein
MKIPSLGRQRFRPVALVAAGHRSLTVATEAGERTYRKVRDIESALLRLSDHVVYAPAGLAQLRHATGAQSWTLSAWRGRETRMRHEPSGTTVTSLRGSLEDSEDYWGDLAAVLHWLRQYGVAPGSISAMAWSLWRASLAGEVVIGFDPEVGRAGLYGGRQEVHPSAPDGGPREYRHMVASDIRAAYPHAMASGAPYALSLREVDPETALDPAVSGLAVATVVVPSDLPYATLPVRVAPAIIQFQWGRLAGVWPWCELHAAADLGCEVKVVRSFAPRREGDIFGAWWPIAQEGRRLPGTASRLAKAITNSLWGQFGMVGDSRSEVRWSDDAGEVPFSVDLPERMMPHAWCAHVAAETTGRVRKRLLTEGLYDSRSRPVHIDTDGIIVRRGTQLPVCQQATGDEGAWRDKTDMARVQIKAPQLYRFTCGTGCGLTHAKWHYVASGLTKQQAPGFFRKAGDTATQISYLAQFDSCLPPGHADDVERRRKLLAEAQGLGL